MRLIGATPHLPLNTVMQVSGKVRPWPRRTFSLRNSEPTREYGQHVDQLEFSRKGRKRGEDTSKRPERSSRRIHECRTFDSTRDSTDSAFPIILRIRWSPAVAYLWRRA